MIGQLISKSSLGIRCRALTNYFQTREINLSKSAFVSELNFPSPYLPWQFRHFSIKKPPHAEKDLDENGFILASILEQRRVFLKSHGMLQDEIEYHGRVVYENNHLYDIDQLDNQDRANLHRMQNGMCPISKDGSFIILHHFDQTHSGLWVALTHRFHIEQDHQLHSAVATADRVNRMRFNDERKEYWQWKASKMKSRCELKSSRFEFRS